MNSIRNIINLGVLSCILFLGCTGKARKDQASFEAELIAASKAMSVEIASLYGTNRLTGAEAAQVLAALQATNRVPIGNSKKREVVSWIAAFNGTNQVFGIAIYNDDIFGYGAYTFKLRTMPLVSLFP